MGIAAPRVALVHCTEKVNEKFPFTLDYVTLKERAAAGELVRQELSTERYIEIPDQVQDLYKIWRPTPVVRAYNLERMLDTPAKIYFKNEGVSPAGSHKPNTAIPQAYYNATQGIKYLATETGGGQWGSAISLACQYFNIDLRVYMVKVSCQQKPYRKLLMNAWGANVIPSPSDTTNFGREVLAKDPDCAGNLGMAISEAVESALEHGENTRYCLGSVMNHVLLHQTVIGEECIKQMEMAGDEPDVVIGCFGGGSNFAGIGFPFIRRNICEGKKTRVVAVEPASCPKLTRGEFQYDFGDTAGLTPMMPMYTLGHTFQPSNIHAGGLRYHGAGPIVSQLYKDGFIEAQSVQQLETFSAGMMFANSEGIIPAPESCHAIAVAVREALKAKEEGKEKTILFNLSGHGMIDLYAFEQYFANNLVDHDLPESEIRRAVDALDKIIK